MCPQEISHHMAMTATQETKQHYRYLWDAFIASVENGHPMILLPKDIADQIGNAAVEDIATRFWYVTRTTNLGVPPHAVAKPV